MPAAEIGPPVEVDLRAAQLARVLDLAFEIHLSCAIAERPLQVPRPIGSEHAP